MTDMSTLWREDATAEEATSTYQALIDNGMAWQLEGHVGRTAMDLIAAGHCMLGLKGHRDFYGNYVPSRFEVEPGTKGSAEYVQAHQKKEGGSE